MAYAWPLEPGITGRQIFVINQRGELLASTMANVIYDRFNPPPWQAAFTAGGDGDMTDSLALAAASVDGNTWVALR